MFKKNMVQNAQHIIKLHLQNEGKEQAVGVDATVGNGHDTCFLSSLFPIQKIYGFDIQKRALEKAKESLGQTEKEIHLLLDSHTAIDKYVHEPIDVAMFNLGYLPSGDKQIVTTAETTLSAIEKTIALLACKGILTIMTYPGHEEGLKEHLAVQHYLSHMNYKLFTVLEIAMSNIQSPCPTLFICIKE